MIILKKRYEPSIGEIVKYNGKQFVIVNIDVREKANSFFLDRTYYLLKEEQLERRIYIGINYLRRRSIKVHVVETTIVPRFIKVKKETYKIENKVFKDNNEIYGIEILTV